MYVNINQTGPTCGMYAYLNGMFTINKIKGITKEKTDELICKLLKENFITPEGKGLTFIGEFFDYDKFEKFLRNSNGVFKKGFNTKNTEFVVKICDISYLKSSELIEDIQRKISFVLFSILDTGKFPFQYLLKKQAISHWIAILGFEDGEYIITDSRNKFGKIERYSIQKLLKLNKRLEYRTFYWKKYKRSNGKTSIDKLIKNQLANKNDFINKKILAEKITHTSGKMIIIKKV